MRLYNHQAQRLYINAAERKRFLAAVDTQAPPIRAFALTLLYTGCRLSEARALTVGSCQLDERLISIRSLKKRSAVHIRELPIPADLVAAYRALRLPAEGNIWQLNGQTVSRITAYRWIKAIMASAEICGPQATAKGLRHGFGVHAIRSGVPVTLVQRWMGHSSLSTTAIYTNVLGAEEMEIAEWMWRSS